MITLSYCKEEDVDELYDVYSKIFSNKTYKLDNLKDYIKNIPNSVLIGKHNNKIISHLFCHPMNIDEYDKALMWHWHKYFNPNGKYLYFWGAGILPEYRTNYNLASYSMCEQIKNNIQKYKNIEKSILLVDNNNKKTNRWHYLVGYDVSYVINNVLLDNVSTNMCVLELNLKEHLSQYGLDRIKRCYGYIKYGVHPTIIGV